MARERGYHKMELMGKERKREHAEKLADRWECRTPEKREKWVKHYMRDDYLDMGDGNVVEIEKPSVKSEFWYGDEYDSPLTDDDAQRKAYFMAENMRYQFKDFGLAAWDEDNAKMERGRCSEYGIEVGKYDSPNNVCSVGRICWKYSFRANESRPAAR